MRRLATALVVAAVAAVVGVAALDAVRGNEAAAPPPADDVEPEGRDRLAAELGALGVRGTLVHSDPQCRSLHALQLPSLEGVRLPRGTVAEPCSFALSPDGGRVAPPHWRWSPDGRRRAACRGRAFVDVVDALTRRGRTWDGCDPAWRPDGTLTLVRDGAVVRAGDGAVLVARAALLDAARRHPATPASGRLSRVDIVDLAWLTDRRLAVALTVHYPDGRVLPQQLLAAFDRGTTSWTRPLAGTPPTRLSTGGGGLYLVVGPGRLVRDDGRLVDLPPTLRPAHALALSPDGLLLAAAVRDSVAIHELRGAGRSVRLPIAARDLAWR